VAAEAVQMMQTGPLKATSLLVIVYLYKHESVIVLQLYRGILYLAAVIPLCLLHVVPATSPQQM
jgi:hypothetical protein